MLKNLFSRIKSEKSSTLKNDEPNSETHPDVKHNSQQKNSVSEKDQQLTQKNETQLGLRLMDQIQSEQSVIKGQIKQVRYCTNEQIPNIFTRVLSCPISHYNLLPHSQRKVKEIDLKKDKYPEYMNFMKPLLQKELPTYNHLLINHYPRGIGIMHHFDGPMYKNKVVVLSLGGPALISFQQNYKKESKSMQIFLEDKSIHVFEEEAYEKYLHGIEKSKVDVITFTVFTQDQKNENKIKNDDMVIVKSIYQEKHEYRVGQSSIKNMKSAKSIHRVIEKNLQKLVFKKVQSEQERYCFQFSQFQGHSQLKGCFIYIRPDLQQSQGKNVTNSNIKQSQHSYKWKMQIQRQQRISITIRQQYSTQFLP